MKSLIKKLWPLLTLVVIVASLAIFYAATMSRKNNLGIVEVNLADSAEISGSAGGGLAFDKSKMTAWSVSSPNQVVEVKFDEPKEVNALLLNENGFNVKRFSVYYDNGAEWKLCYRQNEIGINRLATFYTVKANAIKIVVDDLKNIVRINDIKVYNLAPRERTNPLRVTSYITPNSLNDFDVETGLSKTIDTKCFDTVTDVQFISYGRYNVDGSIAEDKFASNLAYLKQMIGARDVNIFITIFPPFKDGMVEMLRNNMDKAVESTVQMVKDAQVEGVDFDWEYPYGAEQYRLYSEFIVKLKAELVKDNKQLSIAMSPWGLNFSDEAVKAIDQVQIMAYDLFDHNGDNNSYTGATDNVIKYMLKQGFKLEQLNLGVSYYGRPSDASGKWYNFNDPSFVRDEYIMNARGVSFNTPTTLRDKTTYAILRGLGGIMTFAQDEDVPMDDPLSLTAQIGKAKNFFSKGVN